MFTQIYAIGCCVQHRSQRGGQGARGPHQKFEPSSTEAHVARYFSWHLLKTLPGTHYTPSMQGLRQAESRGYSAPPTENFQHRYWDKPIAPQLSTLCDFVNYDYEHTVLWHTQSDMEVVHDCNCNSAVVETPTTWIGF